MFALQSLRYILSMETLTSTQAAKILFVSAETLRRWEAEGVVESIRTKGGHRRYDKASIEALKDQLLIPKPKTETRTSLADVIRERPSMYVGRFDERGIMKLFGFAVDLAVSAYKQGTCHELNILIQDKQARVRLDSSISRLDYCLVLQFTEHFSKTTDMVTLNALSQEFSIQENNQNIQRKVDFVRGKPVSLETKDVVTDSDQTIVSWIFDKSIFTGDYDLDQISQGFHQLASLCPGLAITLNDHKFLSTGLCDLIQAESIHEKPMMFAGKFDFPGEEQPVGIEYGFNWTKEYESNQNATLYVNKYPCRKEGTVIDGLFRGLVKALNQLGRQEGFVKTTNDYLDRRDGLVEIVWQQSQNTEDAFSYMDVIKGLSYVASIELEHPYYQDAVHSEFVAPCEKHVEALVFDQLSKFFADNENQMTPVLERLVKSRDARLSSPKGLGPNPR